MRVSRGKAGEREGESVKVCFYCRFPGVPFRSTVFLMPTTNCLVSLSEPVSELYFVHVLFIYQLYELSEMLAKVNLKTCSLS